MELKEQLEQELQKIHIEIKEEQKEAFMTYMNLLIEWNKKMNLTAIKEPEEVISKHFVDSLTILSYIKEEDSIIDVGTGAGFPGIPIKIMSPSNKVVLLDSLNKRLLFLEEVIQSLELQGIELVHARAEEGGQNKKYRETFDIATSRAVAPLNILAEYLLPFVKVNGHCIIMKGSNAKEEIEASKEAIKILGGTIENIEELVLPNTNIERSIIILKKIKNTPISYPRKAGTPSKNPL